MKRVVVKGLVRKLCLKDLTQLKTLYIEYIKDTDCSLLKGLTNLTSLGFSVDFSGIKDYSFLKDLKNLTKLTVYEYKGSNISFLSDLKNLKKLELFYNNNLKDISAISSLINLEELSIASSLNLKDISALSKLVSLKKLNIEYIENLEEILPISNLVNLKKLGLFHNNNLKDISAISSLINLEELDFENNLNLKDISAVSDLKNLKKLRLYSSIEDISTISSLKNLEEVSIESDLNLKDISALSNLTNLKKLNISYNENLEDVSFISSLKNLEKLNLSWNENLKEIPSLSNLTNLKKLGLFHNNNLKDISAISSLINLERLIISGNENLKEIPPLFNLKNLKELNISYNENLEDVSFISSLINLKELTIMNINSLKETSLLFNLINLKKLDISDNKNLEDISAISSLINLERLIISSNENLKEIPLLSNLTNLKKLDIYNNKNLEDISAISSLVNLEELIIRNNDSIKKISSLSNLINLKKLCISDNKKLEKIHSLSNLKNLTVLELCDIPNLKDISVIKGLTNLKELILCDNKSLEDISEISSLTGLKILIIRDNLNLIDITPLSKLVNLKELHLCGKEIEDISSISNLTNLKELDISYNEKLEDISALSSLINLTNVSIEVNQITDATPIRNLLINQKKEGKKVLDILYRNGDGTILSGNPLQNPPIEVVEQGNEAFLRWFEEETVPAKSLKICLLGNTTAGKSTVINCLNLQDDTEEKILETVKQNYNPNNNSTHGMRVVTKKLADGFTVYFYDFGGQEHFHSTYNLFLNGGIAVLITTKEDDEIIYSGKKQEVDITLYPEKTPKKRLLYKFSTNYWLDKIKEKFNLGDLDSDTNHSLKKLFVIQNKADLEDGDIEYSHPFLYRYNTDFDTFYYTKFEDIKTLDKWKKWLKFREDLKETISRERKIGVKASYQNLFQIIIDLDNNPKEKRDYLELGNLFAIYEQKFPKSDKISTDKYKALFLDVLISLHKTGKVAFLNDKKIPGEDRERARFLYDNPSLKVYFRPVKITEKIYEILDYNRLVLDKKENLEKAKFTEQDLKDWGIKNYRDYLKMLEKEKIIYKYTDKKQGEDVEIFVAPQFLPDYEDITQDFKNKFIKIRTKNNLAMTLVADMIEPYFAVKLISTFLQDEGYCPQYNQGFSNKDICICKVSKKEREDVDKLEIYIDRTDKNDFDRVQILLKALEKIKDLEYSTSISLKEEHTESSLNDLIKNMSDINKPNHIPSINVGDNSHVSINSKNNKNHTNESNPAPKPQPEKKDFFKKYWKILSGGVATLVALLSWLGISNFQDLQTWHQDNFTTTTYTLTCQPTTCQTTHKDFSQNQKSLTIDKQTFNPRNGEVSFNLTVENSTSDFSLDKENIRLGSLKPTEITNPDGKFYTVYFDLDLHSDSDPRPLTIQGFETLELSFR